MSFRDLQRVFDKDDLVLMRTVYDAVCAELGITTSDFDASRRELVAKAIVDAAEQGERDPAVLRAMALARINGGH